MLKKVHFATHLRHICDTFAIQMAFFSVFSHTRHHQFSTAKVHTFFELAKYFLRYNAIKTTDNQCKYFLFNVIKHKKN